MIEKILIVLQVRVPFGLGFGEHTGKQTVELSTAFWSRVISKMSRKVAQSAC